MRLDPKVVFYILVLVLGGFLGFVLAYPEERSGEWPNYDEAMTWSETPCVSEWMMRVQDKFYQRCPGCPFETRTQYVPLCVERTEIGPVFPKVCLDQALGRVYSEEECRARLNEK